MVSPQLKALEGAWKKSEVPEQMRGGFEVPEGDYVVVIQNVSLGDSKGGNYQATWTMKVESGPLPAGKTIRKFSKLYETDKQTLAEAFGWFKADLARFLPNMPADLDELAEALKTLEGTRVMLSVQKKGEFVNKWFQKVLAPDAPRPKGTTSKAGASKAAAPRTAAGARAW